MEFQATKMTTEFATLSDKIRSRTARVGVVGLGYVGLPLAVEFAAAGFSVTGIDVQDSKVAQINAGESYVQDIPTPTLAPLVKEGKLRATTDFSVITTLDTINICVPTPLRKTKDPDMSYVVLACQEIAKYAHPGMLIALESMTYPGTTDELVRPMIERSDLRVGQEFFLCFSPERVDPGNPTYQTRNIPKVVGGVTPKCTELGRLFYSQALESVVPVSSTQVAEMVKLLENTFRMINIGLANELALMCDRWGSTSGRWSMRQPPSPSVSCPSTLVQASAATAFQSTRSTCPGRPGKPASRRVSSSWPATSTARCRASWWTRSRTP
jgi:UDP-N-acetyl-D-glucosamine dehydrogenase